MSARERVGGRGVDMRRPPRDPYATTYHRDGTVTVWLVYSQQWARIHAERVSDQTMATLSESERSRIHRMRGRGAP